MTKEQRRNPRFECTGEAGVQLAAGELRCPARIVNLSEGGCLLILKEPQCLLQDTIVELTFGVNNLLLRAPGQVKAKRSETAIGFQFTLLSDRLRRQLKELIERLVEDLPTSRSPRGPLERRRYRRLDCTGPSTVQFAAGEALCPATIANLSTGGCLIVLREPQLLSQDMLVELTFDINHLPFRVRGQVRTLHSDTTIGFQFPQLSERVRKQLEDLMKELMENILKRQANRKRFSPGECH
jgi:c-di-GMP-binding flagellar brake protein YcgR